ncbi:MAG: hypothetical protein KDA28_04440, partial [Phycisphaerales bacterium]|nr:hypothetical protein [Phycisphaerales bacterium]
MSVLIDLAAMMLSLVAVKSPATGSSVEVHPSSVTLDGLRDRQRLIASATDLKGITRDVTADLVWTVTDPAIAQVSSGVVLPLGDGETTLTSSYDGVALTVPLTVRRASEDAPLSFELDVLPVLTARGCNTGECHGSARGQDGFRLSLFGFDPSGDWHRLVREMPGRRVNRAFPERSLVVEKAIGAVPHTGGRRLEPGSDDERTLVRWIAEGARPDSESIPRVTGIELNPPHSVLEAPGATMSLSLVATYSDGTTRDVTDLAILRTTNDVGLRLEGGIVTGLAPGESFVTASYEAHTVGVPVIVLDGTGDFEYHD